MISVICAVLESPEDQDFVIQIYREYERLMYSVAKKYTSNSAECEDLVQDSILKIIDKIEIIRNIERFTLPTYIVSTIRNTAINQLKRAEVSKRCMDEIASQNAANQTEVVDLAQVIHDRDRILKMWVELSGEDRILLEGKYILGWSDKMLARQLNCQPNSIRMKLTRVRRKALEYLLRQEDGLDDEKRSPL